MISTSMAASDNLNPPPLAWSVILPACFDQSGSLFVGVVSGQSWQARLRPKSLWLSLAAAGGAGPEILQYQSQVNPGGERESRLLLELAGGGLISEQRIIQQAGDWIKAQSDAVLMLPSLTTPRILEFQLLGKFLGELLAKVPEPFTPIALIIAEVIVLVAGVLAALAVKLSQYLPPPLLVPAPNPVFPYPTLPGIPPQLAALLDQLKALLEKIPGMESLLAWVAEAEKLIMTIPLTSGFILEQAIVFMIYLADQTLNG